MNLGNLNPIGTIVDSVLKGADALFTSDEEREDAKLKMMEELNKPHILQAIANVHEAQHPSMFVAGWRPALGWLCVILLAYAWMGRDLLTIALPYLTHESIKLPVMDFGELMTLVLALLGLGATRTFERLQGVERNSWKK